MLAPFVGGTAIACSVNASAISAPAAATKRHDRGPNSAVATSATASSASTMSAVAYTCQAVGSCGTPSSSSELPKALRKLGLNWWLQVRNSDPNRTTAPTTVSQSERLSRFSLDTGAPVYGARDRSLSVGWQRR